MRNFIGLVITTALCGAVTSMAAPSSDITPASKRATTLETAQSILKKPSSSDAFPNAINPFSLNSARGVEMESEEDQAAARAAMLASTRGLITALAEQLEPSGTFVLGGEPILLIGQKKLKVGDKLPINFEGAVYELEISAIETTRFTVRFRNEEFTRPIVITKSGK